MKEQANAPGMGEGSQEGNDVLVKVSCSTAAISEKIIEPVWKRVFMRLPPRLGRHLGPVLFQCPRSLKAIFTVLAGASFKGPSA